MRREAQWLPERRTPGGGRCSAVTVASRTGAMPWQVGRGRAWRDLLRETANAGEVMEREWERSAGARVAELRMKRQLPKARVGASLGLSLNIGKSLA